MAIYRLQLSCTYASKFKKARTHLAASQYRSKKNFDTRLRILVSYTQAKMYMWSVRDHILTIAQTTIKVISNRFIRIDSSVSSLDFPTASLSTKATFRNSNTRQDNQDAGKNNPFWHQTMTEAKVHIFSHMLSSRCGSRIDNETSPKWQKDLNKHMME